jgi:hypothetical protein
MNRKIALALRVLSIPAALLCMAPTSRAADSGRAFAATYQLSNVIENGNKVSVDISITLMNPGSTDVKGGIVAVLSSQANHVLLGSFHAITQLNHGSHATISHTFSIPAAEYASWQQGHAPAFEFLIPSGDSAIAAGIQSHQATTPAVTTN